MMVSSVLLGECEDMKELIIVGAGGFGRELLSYAIDIMHTGECDWTVKGFIDDNLNALDAYDTGFHMLGTISTHEVDKRAVYVCAIGDGKTRLSIGRNLQERGAEFINFIHPTARIRERVTVGVGNIFCPHTSVNPDVTIGDFVFLNSNTHLAHDCMVHGGCSFMGSNSVNGNCVLGKCVYVGSDAVIIPGRKIGEYARIGAGAVVFTHVKPNSTMVGNPAMVLG
jgi:sugar O-acyltransferase (sialic acid O-acetyltransferase NeuD family)